MHRIAANYIFPIASPPIKNGIIEFNSSGEIINVIDTQGDLKESRNLKFYNGIIVPGFINAHCHLELSYLKDKIKPVNGLPEFIKSIIVKRNKDSIEYQKEAIKNADELMARQGIVAVADICNTNTTIQQKIKSDIDYYNLVEVIGLQNESEIFQRSLNLYSEFINLNQTASIVPHAPYSVSLTLLKLIHKFHSNKKLVYSIHNQETNSENTLFQKGSGRLKETLDSLGVEIKNITQTGKSSILSVSTYFPKAGPALLVHNLFTTKQEILDLGRNHHFYWVICPQSNLFIEQKMPDLNILKEFDDFVAIGTDSLASNSTLSILEEIKTISNYYPNIKLNDLLKWASKNGAQALGIDSQYGTIEKGKSPGLNLITNIDFSAMMLTKKSQVEVISFPKKTQLS